MKKLEKRLKEWELLFRVHLLDRDFDTDGMNQDEVFQVTFESMKAEGSEIPNYHAFRLALMRRDPDLGGDITGLVG